MVTSTHITGDPPDKVPDDPPDKAPGARTRHALTSCVRSSDEYPLAPRIMNERILSPITILLVAALTLPGCVPVAPTVVSETPTPVPTLVVTAAASYRLQLPGNSANAPSRLLVVQASVEPSEATTIAVDYREFRLTLPDGSVAQIFDPERASTLVRRTLLAGPPVQGGFAAVPGQTTPGAVPTPLRRRLEQDVLANVFDSGEASAGQGLHGYLVLDTGRPFASLDGAVLEVIAHRGGDSATIQGSYRFAPSATAAATPLP